MSLSSVKVSIYYGYPSLVENSQGDVITASNWFGQFDLIVFGNGIWKNSHDDHLNTKAIIGNLITWGKRVFGYVDLGVSTYNLSDWEMREAIDRWSAMGASCIFWDDAGFDYGVTRERQSKMIDYCYSLSMNVIMNAWNPDDILSGENIRMNSNDIYLLESYLISDGEYRSLTEWKIKADKCADYQKRLGIQMACLSTTKTNDQFTQGWFATAMYSFDYFQATDINYSSTNNKLTFTSSPSSTYRTIWQSDHMVSNAEDTHFSRSTELWTLNVHGDGSSCGYGAFTSV